MAKEVAQTVGGKRIALLVAILAAFAVFATLGNRLGSEGANASITVGPSLSANPAFGNDVTGSDAITYTGTATFDSNSGTQRLSVQVGAEQQVASGSCSAGGTFTSDANSGTCVWPNSGGAAAARTITVNATVDDQPNGAADVTSTTVLTGQDVDEQDTDQGDHTITTPDLTVTKECEIDPDTTGAPAASCGTAQAGDTGRWVITIANASPTQDAINVNFIDEADAGGRLALQSCTSTEGNTCDINAAAGGIGMVDYAGDVPAATTETITIEFVVNNNPTTNNVYDNVLADVAADNISDLLDGGTAQFNFAPQNSASLTKQASPNSVTSVPTQLFSWVYTATNTGTGALTNWVLTDPTLDGGDAARLEVVSVTADFDPLYADCTIAGTVLTCNAPTAPSELNPLVPGASVSITVTMRTKAGAAQGTIGNTATFDSPEIAAVQSSGGQVAINNSPIISIAKTSSGQVGFAAGGPTGTFTITVSNNGAVAANGVSLDDTLPAGLIRAGGTCANAFPALVNVPAAVGGVAGTFSCTITVNLTNGTTPVAGQAFQNTATATFNANTITAVANISAALPALSVSKTAQSGTIRADQNSVFTIVVTNTGNAPLAAGATLTDPDLSTNAANGIVFVSASGLGATCDSAAELAAGCPLPALAVGATATLTLTVKAGTSEVDGSELVNRALVANAANPILSAIDSERVTVIAGALSLTKTNTPNQVGQNGTVTSTLVVANSGSITVNGVNIVDTLPAGTTFVAAGSSAGCTAAGQVVTCTVGNLAANASATRTVRFNVGTNSGSITNNATTTNTSGVVNPTASATVNVVVAAGLGLVHVDSDPASETAAHGNTCFASASAAAAGATTITVNTTAGCVATRQVRIAGNTYTIASVNANANTITLTTGLVAAIGNATAVEPWVDPNQVLHNGNNESALAAVHDNDQATGSIHTVCLISADLGTNDQDFIDWTILATPASLATVSPAGGTKSIRNITDPVYNDSEANCITWRSAGEGGQTVTARHSITGQVFYAAGGTGDQPLIKEWNSLDSTRIVQVTGNVGVATLFSNTQDLASWSAFATGGTCVRDSELATTLAPACQARANVDANVTGLGFTSGGAVAPSGGNAGRVIAAGALSFIDYVIGEHDGIILKPEYSGALDGARQTYTLNPAGSGGTCGSVRVEDPVSGVTTVLTVNNTTAVVLSSDKGVGFQVTSSSDGNPVTTIGNADCQPGETTVITISTREDVQLRSDLDTTPDERVEVRWTVAPPPAKQVFLAWAGQRIILEHDWRIGPATGNDVSDSADTGLVVDPATATQCPIGDNFQVVYVKGAGPGNFLPSLGASINGNDEARVSVANGVNQQGDYNNPANPRTACISRVLYESEDPGEVDIEAFIDGQNGANLSKVAFVVYYMKLENVTVSIVDDATKPSHNGPDNADNIERGDNLAAGSNGDWSPGNPWDASKDVATLSSNVSKDVLVRGRVKGWFINTNPSGRARDASDPLNVLPADRWVMPNDWPLLAGGPDGEEATGTAEQFRPEYDLMTAPNNARGAAFTCLTPIGACASLQTVAADGVTLVTTYGVAAPVEGPFSLIDVRGSGVGGAAVSWVLNQVRNTILPDGDVDWWDAPMPPAMVTVDIRGAGFIKQVRKQDVYWTGTANPTVASCASKALTVGTDPTGCQDYPNQFYWVNIPDSAFIPAVVAGGGYLWNSWGLNPNVVDGTDGPYNFWWPIRSLLDWNLAAGGPNRNPAGLRDTSVTAAENVELQEIRAVYAATGGTDALDTRVNPSEGRSIGRTLVVYSDNHGEFMVAANGDFKLTYDECDTNVLAGGKACAQGDLVGKSSIYSTADYPDFRGKHFPVKSNTVTLDWTWGGYKTVTIEDGEADQFKYIVFHALDRDGFCTIPRGSVSLHPVLSSADALWKVGANDPIENVEFLIDAGEGIIVGTSATQTAAVSGFGTSPNFVSPNKASLTPAINDGKQFAVQIPTFYTGASTTDRDFPRANGSTEECQAWIKVSNSLLGILNVLVVAHDDEGDLGFDTIVDFQDNLTYDLTFRWSLITWYGQDGISPTDALKGTTGGDDTNDIFDQVTAVYGWNQAGQSWLGFFPAGVGVPGANDLTKLEEGSAYWIAIKGPGNVTWTIATDVN